MHTGMTALGMTALLQNFLPSSKIPGRHQSCRTSSNAITSVTAHERRWLLSRMRGPDAGGVSYPKLSSRMRGPDCGWRKLTKKRLSSLSGMTAIFQLHLPFSRSQDGPTSAGPRCPADGCRVWIRCSITKGGLDRDRRTSTRQHLCNLEGSDRGETRRNVHQPDPSNQPGGADL